MSVEDGLTPLLGGDREYGRNGKLPGSTKYTVLTVFLCALCVVDVFISAVCCTGGFGEGWREYLGLGEGTYPFESAGLDILIFSVVRSIFTTVTSLSYHLALRRHSLGSLSTSSYTPTPSLSLQQQHPEGDALRDEVKPKARNDDGGEESGNGDPDRPPSWVKLLSVVCQMMSPLTLMLLIGKCLTRLMSIEVQHRLGLHTDWFWMAVGWSVLMALGWYSLVSAFTANASRYWKLYRADCRGDLESVLAAETRGEGVEGQEGKKYKASIINLVKLCSEDWKFISVAITSLIFAAVAQVMIPRYTGEMIDNVVETGDDASFRRSTRNLVIAAFFCALFSGVRGGIFTTVGASVDVRIRSRLYDSLMHQEIGFFDTTKTGDLTSRLSSDCTKIADQITLNVNVFLRNAVAVIVTLLFMFYLSWQLTLVAFISVPIIIVVCNLYGQYIRKLAKLSQDALAEGGTVAEESLSSMTTVRSFAAENIQVQSYNEVLKKFYKLGVNCGVAYTFYSIFYCLLPQLVTAVVLFYGGMLVMEGQLSGGKVVAFMLYLTQLSDSFNSMADIFSSMTQAVGAADKVFELVEREPKGKKGSMVKPGKECVGKIELKDVKFSYPSRPTKTVLDGVNFTVMPGQVLALVGPSGGGKSSCIGLLENFYQPQSGEVLLDGIPVHNYKHEWLHRSISIVGQEPTLYARSIRDNIIYGLEGDDEPTQEEIEESCHLANAHSFISALPEGYKTQAGERGVQMSGGQKQRIAIARALVRKPKVLLLDEATSALDAESEHLVQQAIDNMISQGGMTVILIAHRLSTVKRANLIAVIEEGKVVEEGTHEDLLSAEGVYSGLVKRQLDLGGANGKKY